MNQIKKIVTTTFRKTQKTGQNLTISEFFDFFYFFPRYLRKLFTVCKERCAECVPSLNQIRVDLIPLTRKRLYHLYATYGL